MPKADTKTQEQKLAKLAKKVLETIRQIPDGRFRGEMMELFFSPEGTLRTNRVRASFKRLKALVWNDLQREEAEQLWYKCHTAKKYLRTMPIFKKEKAEANRHKGNPENPVTSTLSLSVKTPLASSILCSRENSGDFSGLWAIARITLSNILAARYTRSL